MGLPFTLSFLLILTDLLQCIPDQAVYLHHFLNVVCNYSYMEYFCSLLHYSTLFLQVLSKEYKHAITRKSVPHQQNFATFIHVVSLGALCLIAVRSDS